MSKFTRVLTGELEDDRSILLCGVTKEIGDKLVKEFDKWDKSEINPLSKITHTQEIDGWDIRLFEWLECKEIPVIFI